ncbi:ASPIC/UnbV domain-containing protein [Bacteroidota bacterium]
MFQEKQVLINQRANSYLSYHDPRLHIGLGDNEEIDKLEIWWPNGKVESYNDIKVNRYITIKQDTGITK